MSVASYWREIPQRYRMEAGKCKKCGKVFFPPRKICSECGYREFEQLKLRRDGKILTYTIINVGPSKFGDQVPYVVAVVEISDDVNLLCQVADCNLEDLTIGMPVRIEFRKISEDGNAGILNYGYKCVPIY